jgi:hypothetical protein
MTRSCGFVVQVCIPLTLMAALTPSVALAQQSTAAQLAARLRGDIRCPPEKCAQLKGGGPVDDTLGMRHGMAYDKAAQVILCTDPMLVKKDVNARGVHVSTCGQKVRLAFEVRYAEREKTSREIMAEMQDAAMARTSNRLTADLEPGQANWFVSTFGLPGQERVLQLAPMRCGPGCGVMVFATSRSSPTNPGIAEYPEVSSVNQEAAAQFIDRTEKALSRAAANKPAQELDQARQRAPVPKL